MSRDIIEIVENPNNAQVYNNLPLGVVNISTTVTNNNLTGISSFNGLSGNVLLTGAGESVVSVNGQIITVTSTSSASAATSGLATSGFCTGISGALQTQLNTLNNTTGLFYLASNPSGYITGFNSGIYVTTSQTGQFYPVSNPNQYVNSGNLYQTGLNLDSKINSLSGYSNNTFSTIANLQSTGSNLQNQINSINNNTGQFYLNSNPYQYIRSGDVSSVYSTITNLQSTGANLQNQINNITNNTGQFYLSSNPQQYVNSGNLYSTGSNLDNKINSLSGYFSNNPSGYLNSLSGLSTGYVLGISGVLNGSINNLNSNTGNYYLNSNPSGFVGASSLSSYATNTYVNSGFVPKLRYNSFSAPAGSMAPLASGGATATSVSFSNTHYFDVYSFDSASENGVTFQFSLPDIYDNGSLKAKLFCGGASGAISGYVFGICARAYISGDTLNQSFGPESLVTGFVSNSGIIFENTSNYINLTGNISGSDSLVLVKISRKVNDNGDNCNKAVYLYNTNMQWRESITEPQLWS